MEFVKYLSEAFPKSKWNE